jgi:hypothetical protein
LPRSRPSLRSTSPDTDARQRARRATGCRPQDAAKRLCDHLAFFLCKRAARRKGMCWCVPAMRCGKRPASISRVTKDRNTLRWCAVSIVSERFRISHGSGALRIESPSDPPGSGTSPRRRSARAAGGLQADGPDPGCALHSGPYLAAA